jgi:hypothetical protein
MGFSLSPPGEEERSGSVRDAEGSGILIDRLVGENLREGRGFRYARLRAIEGGVRLLVNYRKVEACGVA